MFHLPEPNSRAYREVRLIASLFFRNPSDVVFTIPYAKSKLLSHLFLPHLLLANKLAVELMASENGSAPAAQFWLLPCATLRDIRAPLTQVPLVSPALSTLFIIAISANDLSGAWANTDKL